MQEFGGLSATEENESTAKFDEEIDRSSMIKNSEFMRKSIVSGFEEVSKHTQS